MNDLDAVCVFHNVLALTPCCNGGICSQGGSTGVAEFHSSVLDIHILFLRLRHLDDEVQRHFLVFGAIEFNTGVVSLMERENRQHK